MVSASEALDIVLSHARVLGTEKVPLLDALGRVLAGDLVSREDLPSHDNSSMDGFAVRSSDVGSATEVEPAFLKIVGESSAGHVLDRPIGSGQAARMMTGGLIPKGADTVVPVEHTREEDDGRVGVLKPAGPGQHIRKRGEDIKEGEVVIRGGKRITPGAIGLLAAMGYSRVRVYEKPIVNILATGDELVRLKEKLRKGQIRNSSTYALAAQVNEAGGVPRMLGILPDKPGKLRKGTKNALNADVLVITGGVSVGKRDHVKEALDEAGVEIRFWRVNIKPGMPLLFGTFKDTLVFGLPGNPASTGVTFQQFVRPAIHRMNGLLDVHPMRLSAVLDQDFVKGDTKRHFVRGVVRQIDGTLHVVSTGTQSSGAISSLARANCLVIIPEEVTSLKNGSMVDVELIQSFF
jgi:molybdopterin molybdotransferase